MATRRCTCGIWFEYDERVKDDALECPECGRILPRGARESWSAARLGPSLVWLCALGAVVLAAGGLTAALGLLGDDRTVPAVLALLGGVLGGAILIVLGCVIRALAVAVARLEDRIP
jgi:hypothetical protein